MLQTKRYLGPTQDGLAIKELYNAGLERRRDLRSQLARRDMRR